MAEIRWSPEQEKFLEWCRSGSGSCVLEAVAGAGKSTTLVEAARVVRGQVALMAYNKSAGEELKGKLARAGLDWKKAQAGTCHSFGFSAYRKSRGDLPLRVEGSKVRLLIEAEYGLAHRMLPHAGSIARLVSLAKQQALGVVTRTIGDVPAWEGMADHYDVFDDETPGSARADAIQEAVRFLARSNVQLDVVDFDDMIYMPLLHRARFWQFDVVMVDEAQDTNPARRALVRAMVKRGGRVVAVGDRHQAIYGFTGADADSLDLIAQDFSCARLPLTTTYRCPKAVVQFAQRWVQHIHAADVAPEGLVSTISYEDFAAGRDYTGDDAVLCRNTKPLVALAMTLIRNRVACRIEGRDVASKIAKMLQRWKVRSLDGLVDKLDAWLARETTRLLAKKQESKLAEAEDLVETCRVIIDQCRSEQKRTVADAVAYAESLFSDDVTGMLTLSTIHKAKGREWRRVFWLDLAGTCPSKWARQAWQQDQERNLCYVAATRAKHELVELAAAVPGAKIQSKQSERVEG